METNGNGSATASADSTTHAPTNGAKEGRFKLGSFSIDEYKPIKVVCIGAGYSGIVAGIRFPQKIPNVELTIYDKNAGVGGVWYTNRYPGLACDIPSHCYQLTFEPKTDWSSFYAPAAEILAYLQGVVDKYKLMRYIKLSHKLVSARYDEQTGKWHLRIRGPSGEEFDDTADLLFTGMGNLSRWRMPDIDGLNDFAGTLLHSAEFELKDGDDWSDKKVGVIGVGSSAIQIVANLQPRVKKLVNFVRGKTWLATPFVGTKISELIKRDPTSENYAFTEEDKKSFEDPEYYKRFRHEVEAELNSVHLSTLKGSAMQEAGRAAFKANMISKLAKKPWIADYLIPEFPVACRRLTPGPGYLEALCEDNVDFIPQDIKRITTSGIETADGETHDLDVIIAATGFDTTFLFPFPIIGRNGVDIRDRWQPHPETYLTVAVDGFPNWFMSSGPNAGVGSGSLLAVIERQVGYAVQVAAKMQRERLKSIEPKAEARRDYDEYLEQYFQTTVYSEKCRSWYKGGKEEGRVTGMYAGSCLHALRALAHPRWEDFNYEAADEVGNRFYWLGDGSTYNEKYMTGDRAWYLNDDELDIPPVPSS